MTEADGNHSLHLHADLLQRMDAIAALLGVSRSEVIRALFHFPLLEAEQIVADGGDLAAWFIPRQWPTRPQRKKRQKRGNIVRVGGIDTTGEGRQI